MLLGPCPQGGVTCMKMEFCTSLKLAWKAQLKHVWLRLYRFCVSIVLCEGLYSYNCSCEYFGKSVVVFDECGRNPLTHHPIWITHQIKANQIIVLSHPSDVLCKFTFSLCLSTVSETITTPAHLGARLQFWWKWDFQNRSRRTQGASLNAKD